MFSLVSESDALIQLLKISNGNISHALKMVCFSLIINVSLHSLRL